MKRPFAERVDQLAPRVPNPFAVSGAFIGSMVIAIALGAAPRAIPTLAAVVVLCLFVGMWSSCTSATGAVAAVICAALSGDGFVEDRLGVLSWHGTGDLERLAALAAAALVGLALHRMSSVVAEYDVADPDGAYPPGPLSDPDPLRSGAPAPSGFAPPGRGSGSDVYLRQPEGQPHGQPYGQPQRSTRS